MAGPSHAEDVRALEENLWDMWSAFGRGEGCALVDTPALMRFETPLPYVPYNSVMRCRLGADADDVIAEVLARSAERQVPLMWVVHPTAQPGDLEDRLRAHGLVEAEVCPGRVAPLSAIAEPGPLPPGVTMDRLGPDAREEFAQLVAWRYDLPAEACETLLSIMRRRGFGEPACPTQGWVARLDGRIVAKVVLHVAAGVAGLYGVATRAEARGLGLAKTLTAAAFAHARQLGLTTGILHATPMATPLYASLGFRHVADFRLYGVPGTLHL